MMKLLDSEVFGFLKTEVDVHTMGMSTMSNLLRDCGYKTVIAPAEVMRAASDVRKVNNLGLLVRWINENNISRLSFSYRLDPAEGRDYFCNIFYQLKNSKMFYDNGGIIKGMSFAGLPDTCVLVKKVLGNQVIYFPGDETAEESLERYGVPKDKISSVLTQTNQYDKSRWDFAKKLIEEGSYKNIGIPDHYGYKEAGRDDDSYIKRLNYCKEKHSLPIIRVHAGPYNPDRLEAIKEYKSWVKELAATRLLDVLSIGSSQLTQSNFGEDWEGKHNGGGVPINSEIEYKEIAEIAKPMLVRTYSGTKDVPWMAQMHERTLNISWHALSFWWFFELDGRGNNELLENLREHLEAVRYIATTGKPLEPNVPHHFAFRGGDDVTYVVSAYLAAKTAKKLGIKHLILQNMLNTPKQTWGVQDLAKGRTMLRLVRELEDSDFKVSLQLRAGLDYFAPDLEKAKIQLAAVTALMDDIEPENDDSPQIIHVVSYSEAVRLATPPVIEESIKITLSALREYRKMRKLGLVENMKYNDDVKFREENLYAECRGAIDLLEKHIPNLYTAEGLYKVFKEGFFPVPYLLDQQNKYPKAKNNYTAMKNGGVRVVDENGEIIDTLKRYRKIIDKFDANI